VKVEPGSDVIVDEVAETVWWALCVLIGGEPVRGDLST
jgi:hypothetical protein